MATPFFDAMPIEIMALILCCIDSMPTLRSAYRTNRLTWLAFWRYQKRILRSVIINTYGDARALNAALAVIRFPDPSTKSKPDRERRAIIRQHLELWASGGLVLSPAANIQETQNLYTLRVVATFLFTDYVEKICLYCPFKDMLHLPTWCHRSLHVCPVGRRGRNPPGTFPKRVLHFNRAYCLRVFILYELAAMAFHHRPGGALFEEAEQDELFLDRLHEHERHSIHAVYEYLIRIHSALIRYVAVRWEAELIRELPGHFQNRVGGEDLPEDELYGSAEVFELIEDAAPHLHPATSDAFVKPFASFGLRFAFLALITPWDKFCEWLRNHVAAMWEAESQGKFLGHGLWEPMDDLEFNLLDPPSEECLWHVRPYCGCILYSQNDFVFAKGKITEESLAVVERVCNKRRAIPLSSARLQPTLGFSWTGDAADLRQRFPHLTRHELACLKL